MRVRRLAILAIGAGLLFGGCSSATSPAPTGGAPTGGAPTLGPASQTVAPTAAAVAAPSTASASAPGPASPEATPAPTSAPTYATPEDAVTACLLGVAHDDADAILAASAVDEMATGFDFSAYVDRLRWLYPVNMMAPATDPLYVAANRATETKAILTEARNLIYSLLSTETLDKGSVADKTRADAFVSQVDPKQLAGLVIVKIQFPNPSLENDAKYKDAMLASARTYGADDKTERVAYVVLGKQSFGVGITLLRYGNGWKVSDLYSDLAGTSVYGFAQRLP